MTVPTSTYRLQFRNGMTFQRAAELVPYLKTLGITHLYASPIFAATPGSTHGYDIVDPNLIEADIGGLDGFYLLSDRLRAAGLGLILDIVPNHMAASLENPWWRSVVEWGAESRYARYFDIDWSRRLTLPLIGRGLDDALFEGDAALTVDRDAGCLALDVSGNRLPLNPASYGHVLEGCAAFTTVAATAAQAFAADEEAFHARMRGLLADDGLTRELQSHLDGLSSDDELLASLHDRQSWQLIPWQDAAGQLNYRRFFEITGLAGLRVEDADVFEDSHRLILDLVESGRVDGLRIDHVDGLSDPLAYLQRLRQKIGNDVLLLVEKILEGDEDLPPEWPVDGTTGYEFISALSNLFVHDEGRKALGRAYAERGGQEGFEDVLDDAKTLMIEENFKGEVSALYRLAVELAESEAETAPHTDIELAIRNLLLHFPVYRTYGTEDGLRTADKTLLQAVYRKSGADRSALTYINRLFEGNVREENRGRAWLFRRRFQQLAGPLMAKSLEDTAFYRHCSMLAVNEVGADPGQNHFSTARFHRFMQHRAGRWPRALSTTSTHDTKRGEDARARLYTLSETAEAWATAVDRWSEMNRPFVAALPDGQAPGDTDIWMLFQAIAGAWPAQLRPSDGAGLKALCERLLNFTEKSLREAKHRSNWTRVNEAYETAVKSYLVSLLSPGNTAFLSDFCQTLQPHIRSGAIDSLAQTVVKLTAPGIPDIYQGAEGFDFSLVDPDNRREPDYAALALSLGLDGLPGNNEEALLGGGLKQGIVARCLSLRKDHKSLFDTGSYEALAIEGPRQDHAVAFARRDGSKIAVVIVPRLIHGVLPEDGISPPASYWQETSVLLPAGLGSLANVLCDRRLPAADRLPLATAFEILPVAVLFGS